MGDTATWHGQSARLDRVLAELGLARSRSQAAELIAAGEVRVDGALAMKSATKVAGGSAISLAVRDHYVSRAAHKLIAGLDEFGVDPRGRLALDLGASTGGFTQVLLEREAAQVLAIDVGHDQLAAELRTHPAVVVVEGCNARELTAQRLAELTGVSERPSLVVADLSFISLTLVLPAIAQIVHADTELLLLIKPQFEVGRDGIRDGIVVDAARADAAVQQVIDCAESLGLRARGVVPSPLTGEHGNQEFLAYFVSGGAEAPTHNHDSDDDSDDDHDGDHDGDGVGNGDNGDSDEGGATR